MKVLLAIATESVRSSLTRDLESHKGIDALYRCDDSESALRQAAELRPDVVLLSADLKPDDGFATIQKMVAQVPGVSAILVAVNPAPAHFKKALQAGARDLLEVPVDKKELIAALQAAAEVSKGKRSALEGIAASALAQKGPKIAKRIVIFSTKGGTGKTFIATNLAAGLAAAGKRVALVDLDLQFGDAAIAMGLVPQRTLYDLVQGYTEFDAVLMEDFMVKHASGLSVLPAPLYPDEAEKITVEDVETILDVVQTSYDYVIVDTPPFFEERVLVALDWADHVLLIASLDIPSVKNLKTVFRTMGLMAYPEEKLIILMNRAGSKVGLELSDVEKHLGRLVKLGISSSVEVPRSLNAGEVLLLSKPGSRVSQELAKLVQSFQSNSNGAVLGRSTDQARDRGLFRGR
ncbi:MAG: AAA family ATPase [Chloroflexi bacterium]|nr:AAA family ATPase [Chloroflexota bacterium]